MRTHLDDAKTWFLDRLVYADEIAVVVVEGFQGGTPEDIQQRLAEACVEAYGNDKIKAMHETFGIPNGPVPLAEARSRWRDEAPQWIQIADRLGIKLD